MSRVIAVVEEFLKSIQTPLPELGDVCKKLELRCAQKEEHDVFIKEIVDLLGKYDEKIVQRDESVILSGAEVLPGLSFAEYWSELSTRTQDAIWKYINLILLAGAKHIRYVNRKSEKKTDELGISEKLKDPELRSKMMEAIRTSLEKMPETVNNNEDTENAINDLMSQLNGTNIGNLVKDIVNDLSGELSPDKLGLPEGTNLESMGTEDLMGLIGNPAVSSKLFSLISTIGDKINGKISNGNVSKDDLIRESQELLAKSSGLLNKMNPQVAQMMKSMGLNPEDISKMSSRKVRRAVEKKTKKPKNKVVKRKKPKKQSSNDE